MGKIRRRLAVLSAPVLAIGAIGVMLALAAPAQARVFNDGPPCYGASCVGQSPYITNSLGYSCVSGDPTDGGGAVDLETVQSPDTPYGQTGYNQVTLRWSAYCGANWAKWSGYGADPTYATYWAQSYDGHTESGEGNGYTFMVDGTQLAQACVQDYSDGGYNCTNWH